jgi:C4-dicarboxylate transporter DctQ subunit
MGYVSAVAVIALMLLVAANVCSRYLFNNPIMGSAELAKFLMIIVVFPALAWAALGGKHVKVDIVMERFSPRVQIIVDCITMLAALGIYVFITWQSVLQSAEVHDVTSMLGLPHAPFYWVMIVSWFVFCLATAVLVIQNITKAVKR